MVDLFSLVFLSESRKIRMVLDVQTECDINTGVRYTRYVLTQTMHSTSYQICIQQGYFYTHTSYGPFDINLRGTYLEMS